MNPSESHPVSIIPYRQEHRRGVITLILGIQREEFGMKITLEQQPDLAEIAHYYQRANGNFWVALDAGRVVGTIGLLEIDEGAGALRKMFVDAEHRGRASGVAQRLLETLFDWAASRGFVEVLLGTTEHFVSAHRFYEKHGFEAVDAESLPLSFPRMEVDTRFYRRAVDPKRSAAPAAS